MTIITASLCIFACATLLGCSIALVSSCSLSSWPQRDTDSIDSTIIGMQDHDVYKKRLRADGSPIDEGIKHDIGPENIDQLSASKDENGTVCGSCYGAQTATQQCCNTCDEVSMCICLWGGICCQKDCHVHDVLLLYLTFNSLTFSMFHRISHRNLKQQK